MRGSRSRASRRRQTPAPETPSSDAVERVIVAGCPVSDEADQVVLTILNRLLDKDGYAVQIAPAGALVSEMIAAVVAMNPASIFVSSLEESGRARHLVKRLRTVCPEIPIVVGALGPTGLIDASRRPLRGGRRRRRDHAWPRLGATCCA